MQQTQTLYQSVLSPYLQARRDRELAGPVVHSSGKRYAAVIVETRPHYAMLYVMLNAAWYLPGWTLHVVTSRVNANNVRRVLSPYLSVTYHELDTDNVDIDDYNNLMKVLAA
jgi:hypothetical protein